MILNKRTITLILIFFFISNLSFSKIDFQILLKINNQIITTFDLEKESNYLLALNPKLKDLSKKDLFKLAKTSLTKEIIKKSEITKYKDLNLQNPQISNVLNNITRNLGFSNQSQFEVYLKDFDISIDDLKKKIEIENEWKNLVYAKYSDSIKVDKVSLTNKIEKISKEKFSTEYNLSEIVFDKNKILH